MAKMWKMPGKKEAKRTDRVMARMYQGMALLHRQRIESREQCREVRLSDRVVIFPQPNGEIVQLTCWGK